MFLAFSCTLAYLTRFLKYKKIIVKKEPLLHRLSLFLKDSGSPQNEIQVGQESEAKAHCK